MRNANFEQEPNNFLGCVAFAFLFCVAFVLAGLYLKEHYGHILSHSYFWIGAGVGFIASLFVLAIIVED